MSFLAPVGSTTIHRLTRHVFAFRTKRRNVKRIEKKEEKVSRPRSRPGPSMKRSFTVHVRYAVIKREVYETRNRETGPRRRKAQSAMSGMLLASAERGSRTGTFLFIFGVREELLWRTIPISSILRYPYRTSNSSSFADPLLSFIIFCNDCSFSFFYSTPKRIWFS